MRWGYNIPLILSLIHISTEETLEDSIFVMHERIRKYTPEDVAARATRAIRECVMYGTTKLRSTIEMCIRDSPKPPHSCAAWSTPCCTQFSSP